ncbi:MAG: hypothetical protein AAGA54_08590 [Myxococcota bacterium]
MAVRSHVVARFGFHPSFCYYDTYTRTATYDVGSGEYEPVEGPEAKQWRPGVATVVRTGGTPKSQLTEVPETRVKPDKAVPGPGRGGRKRVGLLPDHWIYVFVVEAGSKVAAWHSELYAHDEITSFLNPKTDAASRLDWSPPKPGDGPKRAPEETPPSSIDYAVLGRNKYITAVGVPYRLSEACISQLEAELVFLADYVEVSRGLRGFAEDGGASGGAHWLEIPVLYPLKVATSLGVHIRTARSEHARRNGLPGENVASPGDGELQPSQEETEKCKEYAVAGAIVSLMRADADVKKSLKRRIDGGEAGLRLKTVLKTAPYHQMHHHVLAELLGVELSAWLSRRLVRILLDGYVEPDAGDPDATLKQLTLTVALASVALKQTAAGLQFLRSLQESGWRGTLLGALANPADVTALKVMQGVGDYTKPILAVGTACLTARIVLEGTRSFSLKTELETFFEATFGGKWKDALTSNDDYIESFLFWEATQSDPTSPRSPMALRVHRFALDEKHTHLLTKVAGGADTLLKVLDAINLGVAIHEFHNTSRHHGRQRAEQLQDVVFGSVDIVKSVLDHALDGKSGLSRVASRLLGTILAAREAWKSLKKLHDAVGQGDYDAAAAMVVATASSVVTIGIAWIGEAGAAMGHIGAIAAAVGVLAALVYEWAKDTELETFVAHCSFGELRFVSYSGVQPGWAGMPLESLASSWDLQLQALAAIQGQFTLETDETMHHQGTALNRVRLRPRLLGTGSRFMVTWRWRDAGASMSKALQEKTETIVGGEGMLRDSDGIYIDLPVPREVYDKALDAPNPIPAEVEVSVTRTVYAAETVSVSIPVHGAAVMNCLRTGKSASEVFDTMKMSPKDREK